MSDRYGDWMQTATGRQFWPMDPRPEDVHIEDIAAALSKICRFGGHCKRFYSVAEHSWWIAHSLPRHLALWGLLHDASEAYISDIIRPVKPFLLGYKHAEECVMRAVAERFHLGWPEPAQVKAADNAILHDEAAQIMGTPPAPWRLPGEPLGVTLECWDPRTAEDSFLDMFRRLTT